MSVTLLEAAKLSTDKKVLAGLKIITERSPILEMLPFQEVPGSGLTRYREKTLGTIGTRRVNENWTRTSGSNETYSEKLTIHGAEAFIDNFIINTMGNLRDVKADQFDKMARAISFHFSEQFFEGDSTVNGETFDGLRVRITRDWPNQLVTMASGGETFTFVKLDELIDKVIGPESEKVLFMNKTMTRIIMNVARNHSSHPLLDTDTDRLGHRVTAYNNIPIRVIERDDNEATILGFDENDGGGVNDTASIYCVRMGQDYIQGLRGQGSLLRVKDFGETEDSPGHLGRIEAYWGLNWHHPRSAARLSRINNAIA